MKKMPTYIVLMKATEKAMANSKDLPKRVQEAREAIEKFGGRLLDWNLTIGQYDTVAKVDFLDDYTVATFTLAAAKSGNQKNYDNEGFQRNRTEKDS